MAEFFLTIIYTLSNGIPGLVIAGIAFGVVVLGLIRGNAGMVLGGGLMMIPITYVTGGSSGWLLGIRLLPLLTFVAAYLVSIEEMLIAWVVAIPPVVFVGISVLLVLFNHVQSLNLF